MPCPLATYAARQAPIDSTVAVEREPLIPASVWSLKDDSSKESVKNAVDAVVAFKKAPCAEQHPTSCSQKGILAVALSNLSMRKCCGCQGGALEEPREGILDLAVLEANEKSVKFSFCAPRLGTRISSSSSSSTAPNRVGRGPLDFVVSVCGGPYSDIMGARQERVSGISCGVRVTHEVLNLQPETEYTITVALHEDERQLVEETLEARTANASTALFAGEDWSCPQSGKDGLKDGDYVKDPKPSGKEGQESSGGASSSWMSSPGASSSSAAAAAASGAGPQAARTIRGDSQDDVSTIAPSEAGDDAGGGRQPFDDNVSEWGSEVGVPAAETGPDRSGSRMQAEAASSSSASAPAPALEVLTERPEEEQAVEEVVDTIHVVEATPQRRTMECKFCSMLDCLKTSKANGVDLNDLVIERTPVPKPEPKPKAKRVFKPYRPIFPGTPVDPRSVGLIPGPGDMV